MRTPVIAAAIVAGVLGLGTVAVVEIIKWEHQCQDAGGHTVAIWTGSHTDYTYDTQGRITGSTTTQDYRYECQNEQGQELNV